MSPNICFFFLSGFPACFFYIQSLLSTHFLSSSERFFPCLVHSSLQYSPSHSPLSSSGTVFPTWVLTSASFFPLSNQCSFFSFSNSHCCSYLKHCFSSISCSGFMSHFSFISLSSSTPIPWYLEICCWIIAPSLLKGYFPYGTLGISLGLVESCLQQPSSIMCFKKVMDSSE